MYCSPDNTSIALTRIRCLAGTRLSPTTTPRLASDGNTLSAPVRPISVLARSDQCHATSNHLCPAIRPFAFHPLGVAEGTNIPAATRRKPIHATPIICSASAAPDETRMLLLSTSVHPRAQSISAVVQNAPNRLGLMRNAIPRVSQGCTSAPSPDRVHWVRKASRGSSAVKWSTYASRRRGPYS